jgi:hypothetical protein
MIKLPHKIGEPSLLTTSVKRSDEDHHGTVTRKIIGAVNLTPVIFRRNSCSPERFVLREWLITLAQG